MEEKTDCIEKVDMVIAHISDCILELYKRCTDDRTPEMVKALAALLNARTAAVITNKKLL